MTVAKRILSGASVLALAVGTAWAGGGQHSQSESGASMSPQPEQLSFEQLDVNRDGQLSVAEYNAGQRIDSSSGAPVVKSEPSSSSDALPRFSELDKNGDGALSMEEGMSNPEISKGWERADEDKDGKLSQSEFETLASSEGHTSPSQRDPSLGS